MTYSEHEDGAIYLSYTVRYPDTECSCRESKCNMCKKVALVKQKIEEKIEEMEVLMRELQDIKEEANHAHCRIIQVLPVEVTTRIFDLYVNWDRDDEELLHIRRNGLPLMLGAICKEWREIAWNTPQIWTNIDIRVDCDNTDKNLDLLCDWILRSGSFYLDIRLLSNSSRTGEAYDVEVESYQFGSLADTIAQCSHRWTRLTMKVDVHFAIYLLNVIQDVSSLEKLKIEMPDEILGDLSDFRLFWNVVPSPRSVDIGPGLTLAHVDIDWTKVTHCRIYSIDSQSFHAFLEGCPLLESCTVSYFDNGSDSETEDLPLTPSPVTHSALQSLSIPFGNDLREEIISLYKVSFPHLYELEINIVEDIPSEAVHLLTETWRHLLPLTPHKLTLVFLDDNASEDYQSQLIRAFPHTVHLRISVHDARVTALPINLSRSGIQNGNGDTSSESLLPLLEVMELEMKWASKEDLDSLIDIFDPFLAGFEADHSRKSKRRPLKNLKLRTEPLRKREQESVIDRLLELTEEGTEVEWLSYDGETILLHT